MSRLQRALLLAPLLLAACGGVLPQARSGLEVAAVGVHASDYILSEAYEAARLNAYEHEESLIAYRMVMRPWDDAVAALRTAVEALRATERALDAVDAGKDGDVGLTLACTLAALLSVRDALTEVGIDVPHELTKALEVVGPISRSVCDGGR